MHGTALALHRHWRAWLRTAMPSSLHQQGQPGSSQTLGNIAREQRLGPAPLTCTRQCLRDLDLEQGQVALACSGVKEHVFCTLVRAK